MKKLSLLFFAAAASSCCYAQKNPTAQKYSQYISVDDATKHLSILASDEFEGRETGKPGAEKAANYIAGEFKKMGLQAPVKGSYFLDVPLEMKAFNVSKFEAAGQTFTNGKDFYSLTAAPAKTIKADDIVFVGYGIGDEKYDDLKGIDITGKVVLVINDGEPMKDGASVITGTAQRSQWSVSRGKRTQFLQSKNPALILAVHPMVAANLKRFGARILEPRMQIKTDEAAAATAQPVIINISTDMADQLLKSSGKTYAELKGEIDAAGAPKSQVVKTPVEVSYSTVSSPVKAVDVLGFMPGSDAKLKNEVLVVSAHYDHIGIEPEGSKSADKINNGADDDGSGTTGMLEIARAFSMAKKAGKGPKRSILFLGNVGEEKGLLGSEYYTDHPVYPLASTIADLNIDMIGRVGEEYIGKADSGNYVYPIGAKMLSTSLGKALEDANNTYTKLNLDYKYDDPNDPNRFYYRSDHYNFAKHNVPIIFFFNGVHADYHQPGDEVSKINFPLLVKRAQLVYFIAWDLANRAERPVVDVTTEQGVK